MLNCNWMIVTMIIDDKSKLINLLDFSKNPGLRDPKQADDSAEEFRDKYVIPALEELVGDNKLVISLDGTRGVNPSFLEELFGGMVRKSKLDKNWKKKIDIISDIIPEYKLAAIEYIEEALAIKQ